jgi:hypothetical protein
MVHFGASIFKQIIPVGPDGLGHWLKSDVPGRHISPIFGRTDYVTAWRSAARPMNLGRHPGVQREAGGYSTLS